VSVHKPIVQAPRRPGHSPLFTPRFTDVIKASERSTDVTIDKHAHGEKVDAEIDQDYRERMDRGEDPKSALVAAKREALGKTEEGREAWAFVEAFVERGRGGGVSYGRLHRHQSGQR
jgi:hypothetical protein